MTRYHIAQFNIATGQYRLDAPEMADFVAALDRVNALAEASPGFVWRLQDDSGNATDIAAYDDPRVIVNMSVWETVEALFDFVYRTTHTKVMSRRREWFERPEDAYQVLWWVPAGHVPTVEEGMARLDALRRDGPTADAFTFKARFPSPGRAGPPEDMAPEPYCVSWE